MGLASGNRRRVPSWAIRVGLSCETGVKPIGSGDFDLIGGVALASD